MARMYPPIKEVRKRAAAHLRRRRVTPPPPVPRTRFGVPIDQPERAIDPISDRLFAIENRKMPDPTTYRPNRNFHEDAVEAREPVGDFGGGEISQGFKVLQERLMGLSNGLSVLTQRMTAVVRPEPPANVGKDSGGPGASSAVARALQQLDRNVESMQVQIDSLTERIVL